MNERGDVHPFQGLGLSRSEGIRFWDEYAESYSSFQQGDIPRRIVRRLTETGFVSKDSSVLEIGSGPGTYSLPLAEAAGSVLCLDSSPRMLARLQGFPDDWDFGTKKTTACRMIGNAFPPPVAKAVGLQIKSVLDYGRIDKRSEEEIPSKVVV